MPELPEVETVRRGLESVLVGERLVHVEQRRPDLRFPFPERFCERLQGQRVDALGRRAKYLLAHLAGGEVLVMHLGMSGRFTICEAARRDGTKSGKNGNNGTAGKTGTAAGQFHHGGAAGAKHDHVLLRTGAGCEVIYNDARRFGYMLLIDEASLCEHPLFRALGPEPLGNELNAAYLAAAARGRRTDLKAFLMDQRTIAGLGNIYVCEALFRAGISPHRGAATLSSKTGRPLARTEALVSAIRSVLQDAIAAGGSSLRDYKKTDGSLGYFQHALRVYGRAGEPCVTERCTGTVTRSSHAGRSTFHCKRCQK